MKHQMHFFTGRVLRQVYHMNRIPGIVAGIRRHRNSAAPVHPPAVQPALHMMTDKGQIQDGSLVPFVRQGAAQPQHAPAIPVRCPLAERIRPPTLCHLLAGRRPGRIGGSRPFIHPAVLPAAAKIQIGVDRMPQISQRGSQHHDDQQADDQTIWETAGFTRGAHDGPVLSAQMGLN